MKRNGSKRSGFSHLLFENGLERGFEAKAFSRRQIGGHDDVLNFCEVIADDEGCIFGHHETSAEQYTNNWHMAQ